MSDRQQNLSWREKAAAVRNVVRFRPRFLAGLVILGGCTAFLEGIGLSFIYPIMEVAQSDGETLPSGPIMDGLLTVYETAGIPFELGYLVLGISGVMIIRFTSSFLVAWLRSILEMSYQEELRTQAFDSTLDAEVGYFDEAGSDDILNAIITETRYSGRVIRRGVEAMETLFLVLIYLGIMVFIAPEMTLYAIVLLGGITYLLRHVIEPGYTVGSRVASANEAIQQSVQAGTQGIRDVKLFGLGEELFEEFWHSVRQYTQSSINLERNKAALQNGYDLAAALSLFVLIYVGFTYSGLSLGALGIFLFAMFRLAPLTSRLNSHVYQAEGNLSHLIRTQSFVDRLHQQVEDTGERSVSELTRIRFDDVSFSYDADEQVLRGLSFEIEKGEFISFVGQSGAGKSTIVSLLARMYDPDRGEILADGVPIAKYDLREWRERIAVVRQQPYIFNDTLENNVTIGNREATRADVERVCEIAKVDEFVDSLPNGYDSQLGDDGVRLSGGQRQRLALARALLKDADFLVLDEATSDLDSSLERDVQAAIESMNREYGIIAIAHRLSTVQNADRIYTVDDGEIVETGTHHELLTDDGEYSKLYTIQSQG
jgi:subfamily B ATP-binding cassette protein MsbA